MIGQTVSHYKIVEKLSEGGMGVVYNAEDIKLRRTVALKFLPPELTRDPEAKERFVHEARAAAALQHSNICTVHEINETEDGQIFIVMDCYEGETLKQKVGSGQLAVGSAIDIAIQVAQGLQKAHEKGIVHRDIKPANIMITGDGEVKILDFGLAKLKNQIRLTREGTTVGTLAYMSPEQTRGEKIDHRTDIWSLGVVLYEMLTGELPFRGEYEQAVMYSILNEDPQPVSEPGTEIPLKLQRILDKTLAKNPEERYQLISELIADLRMVRKDGSSAEVQPSRMAEAQSRKKKILRVLVPVTILILFTLGVLLMQPLFKKKAFDSEPTAIGVMYFENETGEERYDYLRKVLADMVITDLSQSSLLRVITFESMFDLLKSLGHDDTKTIDASVGARLCALANARLMVLGTLTKSGDTFVANARVLDVETKEQLKAYRVTGKGEDSILGHLVDDLSDKIKGGTKTTLKRIQEEKADIKNLTTTSLEAYKYYLAGREAVIRTDHKEAIDNLEIAVALDSTFVEAYDALTRQYYYIRDMTKTNQAIQRMKSFSDRLTQQRYFGLLALEAFVKHNWDVAIEYYNRLIHMNPEDIASHISLGLIYYQKKAQYDKGIFEFEKVLELDRRGLIQYSHLSPAERKSKIASTYVLLGYAYLREGEVGKAGAAFEEYAARTPGQAQPLTVLGDFHLITGDYDKAAAHFQRSLQMAPQDLLASRLLGDTYLATGRYDMALSLYEKSLSLALSETEKADAQYLIGKLDFLKGHYEGALQACQRALQLDSTLIEAHWILGLTHVKRHEFDQAGREVMTMERLIEEEVQDPRTYYYHLSGELALGRGLYDQALEDLNKAAGIRSLDRTLFLCELAEAYFRVSQPDTAIKMLQEVLRLNPSYAQAHDLLGQIYETTGKPEEAREHLRQFLDIWENADPDVPQFMDVRRRLLAL